MGPRLTQQERDDHAPRYLRYTRGKTPIRPQRPVYGYRVVCACGWEQRVNGDRRAAEGQWRSHVLSTRGS